MLHAPGTWRSTRFRSSPAIAFSPRNPNTARIKKLAEQLRSQLVALGSVTIHDLGVERCGIVTFNVEGIAPAEVQSRLAEMSINVSVAQEESSRLDLVGRGLTELVRASVHYYNSEDEIERFCNAVARM